MRRLTIVCEDQEESLWCENEYSCAAMFPSVDLLCFGVRTVSKLRSRESEPPESREGQLTSE